MQHLAVVEPHRDIIALDVRDAAGGSVENATRLVGAVELDAIARREGERATRRLEHVIRPELAAAPANVAQRRVEFRHLVIGVSEHQLRGLGMGRPVLGPGGDEGFPRRRLALVPGDGPLLFIEIERRLEFTLRP